MVVVKPKAKTVVVKVKRVPSPVPIDTDYLKMLVGDDRCVWCQWLGLKECEMNVGAEDAMLC